MASNETTVAAAENLEDEHGALGHRIVGSLRASALKGNAAALSTLETLVATYRLIPVGGGTRTRAAVVAAAKSISPARAIATLRVLWSHVLVTAREDIGAGAARDLLQMISGRPPAWARKLKWWEQLCAVLLYLQPAAGALVAWSRQRDASLAKLDALLSEQFQKAVMARPGSRALELLGRLAPAVARGKAVRERSGPVRVGLPRSGGARRYLGGMRRLAIRDQLREDRPEIVPSQAELRNRERARRHKFPLGSGRLTYREAAALIGTDDKTIANRIRRAVELELIVRTGPGQYVEGRQELEIIRRPLPRRRRT